jgi:alpha-ribazole phosphatase/probable phosphoglycerate mutase
MLTFYLLRHGETSWNADNNRYCGRTDIDLTEKGIRQAETVREQLKGVEFDGIFSSPLKRARITAEIVSGKTVQTDQRLIEADFGSWEYKTREEFVAEAPELWENWNTDPTTARAGGTGETGQKIVQRMDDFFNEIKGKYNHGKFLVVAHNGVNRLYMAHKLGMPLKNYRQIVQLNSSLTQFTLDEQGVFTLHYLNTSNII